MIIQAIQILCENLGGRGVSKNVTKCHVGGGGLPNKSGDIFKRFFQLFWRHFKDIRAKFYILKSVMSYKVGVGVS